MTAVTKKRTITTINLTKEMFNTIEKLKETYFFSRSACVRRLLELGINEFFKEKKTIEDFEKQMNDKVIKKMIF